MVSMPSHDAETKKARDAATIEKFIAVYCRKKHATPKGELCDDCADLLDYARGKLAGCPMDPKPKCKDCPVHCYSPEYRQRIKDVMRLAGIYSVKRGRLDWLVRYFW